MAGNIFQDGMNAFADTNTAIEGIQKRRAQYRAAPKVAAGDFTGAAQAYGAAGMPDEARGAVVDQQVMDARAEKRAQDDNDRKKTALMKATQALRTIPRGANGEGLIQRKAALATLAPLWDKVGIDGSHFANMTPQDLDDPNLDAMATALGEKPEEYTLDRDQVRYRGATPIARGAPKPLELDPTKNYYMPDTGAGQGGGQPVGQGAEPPPPPPPPNEQGPAVQGALQPRGLRNNNPLNVTSLGGGQQWDGQAGADGQYAKFGSIDQGLAAADKNLQAYGTRHGINTVAGVIQRWAPQGKDGNPTAAYITTVSNDLGIAPNQTIDLTNPQTRQALLRSMAKVELGQPLPSGRPAGEVPPRPAASSAPGIPGYRQIQQAKPQWEDMADGRQRNVVTGKVEGTAKGEDDSPMDPATVEMQAAMYLSTRQLPPMGMGKTGTRNRTMILNKATQLAKGLGLDANDIVAGSMSVKAAGQALNKATTLRSQVEGSERTVSENANYALSLAPKGAGPSRAPVINRWIQAGRKQIAGDADVAQFDQAIKTVAEEYAKVMTTSTGTGGQTSDSARQEAYHRLNGAMNPAQLKAVIDSMKVEMDNRAKSLRTVEDGLRTQIRGGSGGGQPAASPAPAAGGNGGWRVVKVH